MRAAAKLPVAGGERLTSRQQAKRQTRARLLEAARRILLAKGEGAVKASAVARAAGLANATFYEHFANTEELLRTLAEELFSTLRAKLRNPRREAIRSPTSEEKLREQYRVPLQVLAANPGLFRFALRVRHQPASAFGESSLRLEGNTRRDLVEEYVDRGYPNATPVQRRRLEMIADINIAAVEALALGHLSGRYPDVEELVDILVLLPRGGFRLARELPAEGRTARSGESSAAP